ncbi:MAG: relaxase domain-containing protein, partial [Phycisphaeraceae bacterium]|nr:relaxase domain-containing protein [Phycisphaeraceae bacterium]
MITIGKVRNADYYLNELHQDDAYEYYGSLERSGRWHGTFAEELGLAGAVDPDDFRAVLEGVRPDTGTSLTEFPIKVPALDVTLSVPKSMSVVWGVGDHETRRNVERAIDAAEAAVVRLLETEATIVRRGHGGLDYHGGDGLIVASFDHRTSRLGDPNLHRHLVVANASPGPDGRITGIDTRQLYNIRYTAEAVFQSVLRHELARSQGLLYGEIDRHGVGEIAGVPLSVRREFSQRRRDIELEMLERGVTSGRGARFAALATRPSKEDDLPDDVLRRQWRDRANALGFDANAIPTVERTPKLACTDEQLAFALTEHDATYARRDVIRHTARSANDGASLDQILRRSDDYLAGPQAIERMPGVYTTPEIIQLETRAAALAVDGLDCRIGVASNAAIADALAIRPHLADEQRHLVEQTARSGDAITVVVGKAGAGKTTALDALRDAYERDGHRVLGAALSARAAAELDSGAGIHAQTIHRTLHQLPTGALQPDRNTVLVIDEAG